MYTIIIVRLYSTYIYVYVWMPLTVVAAAMTAFAKLRRVAKITCMYVHATNPVATIAAAAAIPADFAVPYLLDVVLHVDRRRTGFCFVVKKVGGRGARVCAHLWKIFHCQFDDEVAGNEAETSLCESHE